MAAAAVVVAAGAGLFFSLRSRDRAPRFTDLASIAKSGGAAGYNVLLITLDTVRSDRLGSYGYEAAQTPNLDALVQRGVQFDEAITPVPVTLPSHASIMTGLYPPRHGVRDNGLFRLAQEHETLAERLKGAGYETAAFVGCFVLDRRYGLGQGFDVYDFQVAEGGAHASNAEFNQRSAGAVSDAAIGWLNERTAQRREAPFFMWAHYFDAHVPYESPLGVQPQFADRPYDAEIAYIDQELGRVLAELDRSGLLDRTLIAVVSDHGEGLREHGESTHGLFVYGSTVRVAFILSCRSLFASANHVRDRVVSLVDLRPTLEDLLGLGPGAALDGESLVRAGADSTRALYIETKMPFHAARCSPLYGLQRLRDKYIHAPQPEYYDLRADPGETRNAYASRADATRELAEELREVRGRWAEAERAAASAERELSSEETERLQSLGYVGGSIGAETESLPDPKAMMSASRKLTAALRLQRENRLEEALRTAREAAQECPGYIDATDLVARLCQQLKRPEEAIAVLKAGLAINPVCGTALQLARTYMLAKRWDEMEGALQEAAELEPDNGFIHVLRGDRLATQGRLPEALAEYEEAIRVDEHRVGPLVRPHVEKLRARMRGATGAPGRSR